MNGADEAANDIRFDMAKFLQIRLAAPDGRLDKSGTFGRGYRFRWHRIPLRMQNIRGRTHTAGGPYHGGPSAEEHVGHSD